MGNLVQAECNECQRETNCTKLHSLPVPGKYSTKKNSIDQVQEYCIVQCRGCDSVFFLIHTKGKVTGDSAVEKPFETKESFPDGVIELPEIAEDNRFLIHEHVSALPPIVKKLYLEVEQVFTTDLPILSGMGLRSLLEAICVHQAIPGHNLKERIDNLHKKGFISSNDVPILHTLREIGNMTVHQIKSPSSDVLDYALEIINHTLKGLYIIPKLGAKLNKGKQ